MPKYKYRYLREREKLELMELSYKKFPKLFLKQTTIITSQKYFNR